MDFCCAHFEQIPAQPFSSICKEHRGGVVWRQEQSLFQHWSIVSQTWASISIRICFYISNALENSDILVRRVKRILSNPWQLHLHWCDSSLDVIQYYWINNKDCAGLMWESFANMHLNLKTFGCWCTLRCPLLKLLLNPSWTNEGSAAWKFGIWGKSIVTI